MRECIVPALILFLWLPAAAQTAPSGWKTVRDDKSTCQISVPPEWVPYSDAGGSAVFRDAGTAIAVVTSQPGQAFKPLPPAILKLMDLRKEKLFENSAQRIFYQDKTSRGADDTNAFSGAVPAKGGTCSCRVVVLPAVSEEIARKIVLTLMAVPEPAGSL
jgi:hypothetical protein